MLAASSATSAAAWCAPRIAVRDPKVLAGAHRGAHRRWGSRTRAADPPDDAPRRRGDPELTKRLGGDYAAAGITGSAVGVVSDASGAPGPSKGKGFTGAVWHFHKTGKQAKAFSDKFGAHEEEPFKSIVASGAVQEGFFAKAYTVAEDKEYFDKFPKA